jgi:hypothetical protein
MIIKSAKDFGGKWHPDILGYKCFRCDLALRRYPVIEWVGAIGGTEIGSIYLHPKCADRLGKELGNETKQEHAPPT